MEQAIVRGAVRGKRKMPRQKPGESEQVVCTPPEFIAAVERRFGKIGFDLACTSENVIGATKRGYMFDKGEDALVHDWARRLDILHWLNPEFGNIDPFAQKAAFTAAAYKRFRLTMLVPAARETDWHRNFVRPFAFTLDLYPRIQFVGHEAGFPKGLQLCVFEHGLRGSDTWDWKHA